MTHIQPLKIEVPLKVVEALEELHQYNNPATLYNVFTAEPHPNASDAVKEVRAWIDQINNSGVYDYGQPLMQVLTGNYTVALTPEDRLNEKIKAYWDSHKVLSVHDADRSRYKEYVRAYVHVCQELKIPVNVQLEKGMYRALRPKKTVPEGVPVITTKVERALKSLRQKYSTHEIYQWVYNTSLGNMRIGNLDVRDIHEWFTSLTEEGDTGLALMQLLSGVYQIEYTPEELIAKLYNDYAEKLAINTMQSSKRTFQYRMAATLEAANILGLDIDTLTKPLESSNMF